VARSSQLSEEQKALARFEAAAKIYQKLLKETDQADYRRQLASTLVDVGLSMQTFGELAAADRPRIRESLCSHLFSSKRQRRLILLPGRPMRISSNCLVACRFVAVRSTTRR
jgi:hypothetical protein